jgi:pimeloyl-ACP methyl ester carboxylesterase
MYWLLPPALLILVLGTAGCGTFIARRMVQAPNTFPTWFAPKAPVLLAYTPNFLTNFPRHFVTVGPPAAQLCYRVVMPADYRLTYASTNWLEQGENRTQFSFRAELPAPTNRWTSAPRGTVVLLHGYALAQFSLAPWALRLAQDGWECVLVDLRGHGRSTGPQIYYGLQEVHDLSQLLDQLARDRQLTEPVAALGESYGAAMALRWMAVEPRIHQVVAITPYAGLSNSVLNLRQEYAHWLPKFLIKAGLKQLPAVLGTGAEELDTTTVLARHPMPALLVAATKDKLTPEADVKQLLALAAPGSRLIVLPGATHETATYYFAELVPAVLSWLAEENPTEVTATRPKN